MRPTTRQSPPTRRRGGVAVVTAVNGDLRLLLCLERWAAARPFGKFGPGSRAVPTTSPSNLLASQGAVSLT